MLISRRSFTAGLAAAASLTALGVNASQKLYLWADGIHDDTEAFDALVFRSPSAVELSPLAQAAVSVRDNILRITHGRFRISSLDLSDANTAAWDHVEVSHCWFNWPPRDIPENGYLIHLGAGL